MCAHIKPYDIHIIFRQSEVFNMKEIQRKCVVISTIDNDDTIYIAVMRNNKEKIINIYQSNICS